MDLVAYLQIELTDAEKESIKAAEEAGLKVYGVTISIQKDCLLKAARAFLVFKAVEEFGQILVYNPSSQDIEDEKFEFDFSVFLITKESIEETVKIVKSVSEIEEVVAEVFR